MSRTVPEICVAAAVITRGDGRVLISLRPSAAEEGGLWEFPGGKLEAEETALQALERELAEELGIAVRAARPLLHLSHQYPRKSVQLFVFQVDAWEGQVEGREGQRIQWVAIDDLESFRFLAANASIIRKLQRRSIDGPE